MTDIFRPGQDLRAPYSSAWAAIAKMAIAKMAMPVVAASRTG